MYSISSRNETCIALCDIFWKMFTVRPEQGILTPLLANLKNIYPLPGDVLDMGEKLPVEVHCAHHAR